MDFDTRYGQNYILQKMREDFRNITLKFVKNPRRILEIGCGTGIDLEFFANKFGGSEILGIDVSKEMVKIAEKRVSAYKNVRVVCSTVENINKGWRFDFIYSYFGAINTVYNLKEFANNIALISERNSVFVFSCVNKYYLFDMLFYSCTLRFKKAFSRMKNWKGYSPFKSLKSKPLSYGDIKKAFLKWDIIFYKGYSILYPAWYRYHRFKERNVEILWKVDNLLNYTPLRFMGEYSLYVLRFKG